MKDVVESTYVGERSGLNLLASNEIYIYIYIYKFSSGKLSALKKAAFLLPVTCKSLD